MTNTDTADPAATASQVQQLAEAGSELVRVTVNNKQAAAAVPELFERLADAGCAVPLVGDFHYNGHILLRDYPRTAALLAKYRINPGNVGTSRRDENFQSIVRIAVENGKAVRIGVNWGSLDQRLLTEMMDANGRRENPKDAGDVLRDAIVESAVRSADLAVETGLSPNQIVLSAKVSGVRELIAVYRQLAPLRDHALHLGLTEAGMGSKGIVATARRSLASPHGRDRRHDPSLPHASPRRRPCGGGPGRPADPTVAGDTQLRTPGHGVPRLRTHHQHVLPGDDGGRPGPHPGADARSGGASTRAWRT